MSSISDTNLYSAFIRLWVCSLLLELHILSSTFISVLIFCFLIFWQKKKQRISLKAGIHLCRGVQPSFSPNYPLELISLLTQVEKLFFYNVVCRSNLNTERADKLTVRFCVVHSLCLSLRRCLKHLSYFQTYSHEYQFSVFRDLLFPFIFFDCHDAIY